MKLNKKGFTIVELVIVIAVIAILAAVLIPTFNSVISKANESAALQEARAAETVLIAHLNGNLDGEYYFVDADNKYLHKYTKADGLKLVEDTKDITIASDGQSDNAETKDIDESKIMKLDYKVKDDAQSTIKLIEVVFTTTEQGDVGTVKVYKKVA